MSRCLAAKVFNTQTTPKNCCSVSKLSIYSSISLEDGYNCRALSTKACHPSRCELMWKWATSLLPAEFPQHQLTIFLLFSHLSLCAHSKRKMKRTEKKTLKSESDENFFVHSLCRQILCFSYLITLFYDVDSWQSYHPWPLFVFFGALYANSSYWSEEEKPPIDIQIVTEAAIEDDGHTYRNGSKKK